MKREGTMIKINNSDLERLEFDLVKYQGENEVWVFDNETIIRDPKTEEIIEIKEKQNKKNTIKL